MIFHSYVSLPESIYTHSINIQLLYLQHPRLRRASRARLRSITPEILLDHLETLLEKKGRGDDWEVSSLDTMDVSIYIYIYNNNNHHIINSNNNMYISYIMISYDIIHI